MNEIKVTVELCAEDRARLDKISSLLETKAVQGQAMLEELDRPMDDINRALEKALNPDEKTTPAEPAKNAQEAPTASDHPTLDPFPETPTAKEETVKASENEEKPTVTMDMLRSKAITLAAAGKKDQVRDVVHPYAPKVTELPEDKWREVYSKLCALEG